MALLALGPGCTWDWDRLQPRALVIDAGDAPDGALDATIDGGEGCACGPAQLCCGGRCLDPGSDPDNCGRCDNRCPNTTCQGGSCTNTCRLGYENCNGNAADGCEVNVLTSDSNCGRCNNGCTSGRACVNGACTCQGTTADCDGNMANGCETDTNVDAAHCGMCGNRCPMGQSCAAGQCVCPGGFADCDGMAANGCEVDPRASSAHCGGCNRACGDRGACAMGACQCSPGWQRCPAGAQCNTALLDPMNCGMCGRVCEAPTALCAAGGCVAACPEGTTACGMVCADLTQDGRNCGTCGRACGAHQRCAGAAGCACEEGWADCDMDPANGCEVELRASAAHCGRCGVACGAGQSCRGGTCGCAGGFRDCGGRCAQCCADTDCDDMVACTADRCVMGACTFTMCARCCPGLTGAMACRDCCADADCTGNRACGMDGRCGACRPGFGDCDMNPANGCETTTNTSANCGACGTRCAFDNATAACRDGRCALVACTPGFADCDMNPANGCEVSLRTSAAHCGACGNACTFAGGSGTCVLGVCSRTVCDMGRGDCDGNMANGCEVDLATDPRNCRLCGNACAVPNATPGCVMGACTVGMCDPGRADCDRSVTNGCEVNTNTDVMNCSGCGVACAFTNGNATCTAGACALGSCRAGFGNCDAMASNGCETALGSNLEHCGACGRACAARPHAVARCDTGACRSDCEPGFADCNGNPADGCETDVRTSLTDCGGCGNTCAPLNGTGQCVLGVCSVRSCFGGFEDCDRSVTNGCEAGISSDTANCGACGRTCALPGVETQRCSGGTCVVDVGACRVGTGDCDGAAANGCEANLLSASGACGRCGVTCATGRSCSGAFCTRGTFRGYTITTPTATELPWVDACALPGSRSFLSGQDDGRVFFTTAPPPPRVEGLLPFPVELFGGLTTAMAISSNGHLLLGDFVFNATVVHTGASYGVLPSTGEPSAAVFIFGRDLVLRSRGTCIGTTGAAPNRRFVVEYYDAGLFAFGTPMLSLTFEAIFNETSQVIEFLYDTPFSGTFNGGSPRDVDGVTVGLQSFGATQGVMHSGRVGAGSRVRFSPM
ncbi:MAG: hypothetical protein HY909_25725 [Deltaproteobacteria bacterium]|nr:hypothetical protein [Deltaproteobacteria bacterium]